MRDPTRQAKQNSSTCGSSGRDASTRRAQMLGVTDQVNLRIPKGKKWISNMESKSVGVVNISFESCGGSSRRDASTRRAQLWGMPDQVKLRTPKDNIWIPKTESKNVGVVNMLFESCGGSATCVLHCMAMQSQAKQSKAKQSQAKQSQAKQSQAKQSTAKQASK